MNKIAVTAFIGTSLLLFGGVQIAAAAEPEPYVVECLEGTPGPARWSDGSVRYSQWCFDTHGGREYLGSEGR
ncbi:hypothetical protein [Nocardia sp. Marseille-Q1738]